MSYTDWNVATNATSIITNVIVLVLLWLLYRLVVHDRQEARQMMREIAATLDRISNTQAQISDTQREQARTQAQIADTQREQSRVQQSIITQLAVMDARRSPNDYSAGS
jgi:septal ring factor EnvC (AmiA/AmiB activator)